MQQSNGSRLFRTDDPRSSAIGIIEVAPHDDRQSILTAIFTQEKLGRKHIALVVPAQSSAFRRATGIAGLKQAFAGLQAQVVFITPQNSSLAKFARQHQLPLFLSLEKYAQYAQTFLSQESSPPIQTPELADTQPLSEPQAITPETTPPVPLSPSPPDDQINNEQIPINTIDEGQEDANAITNLPPYNDTQPAEEASPMRAQPSSTPTIPATVAQQNETKASTHTPIPVTPSSPPLANLRVRTQVRRAGRRWLFVTLFVLLLLAGLALSTIAGIGPLPQFFPGDSATITITPNSTTLQKTSTISAVTGVPDTAQQQVAARFLFATPPTQTSTVQATGVGITSSQQAHGQLTFYNALPHTQTIPAGTVLNDNNGIQIVSDQAAIIRPAQPPMEGTAKVAAHAVTPGVNGNIPTDDFNAIACCDPGITVKNEQPFNGGQNQQIYSYIQQRDIDTAAQTLTSSLIANGQQDVQEQMLQSDQFVSPPQCKPLITSNYPAGTKVSTVTVSATASCLGEVYDQQAAQSLAANQLEQVAQHAPGTAYALEGYVTTRISSAKVTNPSGTILLHVQASGTWTYQFQSNWSKQQAIRIAGKNIHTATTLLQQQTGVKQAHIVINGLLHTTLPTNQANIRFVLHTAT